MLLQFCTRNGYGMACQHNNKVTPSCDGAPILAFAIIDKHAYFYKNQSEAKQALRWTGRDGAWCGDVVMSIDCELVVVAYGR